MACRKDDSPLRTSSNIEVGKIVDMTESDSLVVHHHPSNQDQESLGSALALFSAKDLGLKYLGGDVETEVWTAPVNRFGLVALTAHDPIGSDPAAIVKQTYLDLYSQTQAQGFSHWLRIWQFIPAINHGQEDEERYRRFCVGRAEALAQLGLSEQRMCAATAIGCFDETFRLFALVGHQPGRAVENPRQVSAWQYPPQYGPASPAFARATAILDGDGELRGLLVSGTAAVLGHASAHPNDAVAQTREAMSNVEAVLAEAKSRLLLDEHTYVRVYLRHAEDWPEVYDGVKQRWPTVHVMGLLGEICRDELLVEIEVWQPQC